MKLSGMQYKGSRFCIFLGMTIVSFSLFLHPKDPKEFLELAIFNPQETFQFIYGFVQTIAFWTGAGLMCMGLIGMLHILFQSIRHALLYSRPRKKQAIAIDNEDNWIFL